MFALFRARPVTVSVRRTATIQSPVPPQTRAGGGWYLAAAAVVAGDLAIDRFTTEYDPKTHEDIRDGFNARFVDLFYPSYKRAIQKRIKDHLLEINNSFREDGYNPPPLLLFDSTFNMSMERLGMTELAIFNGRLAGQYRGEVAFAEFRRGQLHGAYYNIHLIHPDRHTMVPNKITAEYFMHDLKHAQVVQAYHYTTREYANDMLVKTIYHPEKCTDGTVDSAKAANSYSCTYLPPNHADVRRWHEPFNARRIVEQLVMADGTVFNLHYDTNKTKLLAIVNERIQRDCDSLTCAQGSYKL